MNVFEKIKRSWWIIFSIIPFFNGVGFIYIGSKYNNKNWILEGILYELPWFIYIFCYPIYSAIAPVIITLAYAAIALILMFIGIIRSVWVAVKLLDVYDNEEKYLIQSTGGFGNTKVYKSKNDSTGIIAGCICVFVLFIVFAIIAL